MVWCYLQIGILETAIGLLSYFIIFRDFGFGSGSLFRLQQKPYFPHKITDVFNPLLAFFGNTNVACDVNGRLISLLEEHKNHFR